MRKLGFASSPSSVSGGRGCLLVVVSGGCCASETERETMDG